MTISLTLFQVNVIFQIITFSYIIECGKLWFRQNEVHVYSVHFFINLCKVFVFNIMFIKIDDKF